MNNKHLLMAAVLGVGLAGLAPVDASAQSKADQVRQERREERKESNDEKRADAREASRYDEDGDRLTYENLPGEVKNTLGKEMGQRTEVVDVRRVTRDGKTFFREIGRASCREGAEVTRSWGVV